ncbi:MAG: DNA repair protein RecO [Deltaproteobacteria bacterium]|nr:DNA repair protein RecO [Deltaproteobacteria bacterium]MBT4087074.1 DNA repair protein RecO [Deltaproteobacteria bacterium]MBT4266277.1 DNA repair protein RecO [Deltaproteobacteria bacterium]MBT6503819.1 DNA repair protein RecO [Deltaproteobacteria bacterium]MBT6615837.1 DNA repair protein RecO [Deltaproteobacteria bacterium]
MKTLKEPLFLVTSTPYRDSDIIVNLLSSRNGKLSAIVYNGRKLGKTSSFLYQPGDLLDVEYRIKESDDFIRILNIAGKSILNARDFSYKRFLFHSYLLEIISKISQPGNPSGELFEILADNNRCSWAAKQILYFIGRFIWQLIQHSGFGVDYHTCKNCQRQTWQVDENRGPVFRKEQYRFHHDSGAMVCSSCSPITDIKETLTPAMLKVIWILDNTARDEAPPAGIPDAIMVDVIKCLNQYLLQRYGIRPKSLPLFFDSLKPLP